MATQVLMTTQWIGHSIGPQFASLYDKKPARLPIASQCEGVHNRSLTIGKSNNSQGSDVLEFRKFHSINCFEDIIITQIWPE